MKNFFKIFVVIALVAVTGFSFTACKSGDEDGGNSGRDSRLVLEDGYAWGEIDGADFLGIVFKANGTFQKIEKEQGVSYSEYGKWSTTGNNSLTLVWDDDGYTETISYTVTSTTFTIHENHSDTVFTKMRIPS